MNDAGASKLKRVLLISPLPPPAGGIATWTQTVLERGIDATHTIELVDTRVRHGRPVFAKRISFLGESWRSGAIVGGLLKKLVFRRPNIVHLNCSLSPRGIFRDAICVALGRAFGVPVVTNYRGDVSDYVSGGKLLSTAALRFILRYSAGNIAVSATSEQALKQLKPERSVTIRTLPNFVDVATAKWRRTNVVHDKLCVLYAGGITRKKGCDVILEVARRLPGVEFKLVGYTDSVDLEWISTRSENVKVDSEIPHDELVEVMCQCDVLVFASRSEGFPNAVGEAMLAGLPVVATRVGAIPEMIEHGKGGFLVAVGDIPGICQALKRLEVDRSLISSMGMYNRERAIRDYSYPVVMRRWVLLYQELLGSHDAKWC